jgi:hypothetical protein
MSTSTGTKPRWRDDGDGGLYIWDNAIVGTAAEAPNGRYYAYGCDEYWQDVMLGSFSDERDARTAVENWVRNRAEELSEEDSQ